MKRAPAMSAGLFLAVGSAAAQHSTKVYVEGSDAATALRILHDRCPVCSAVIKKDAADFVMLLSSTEGKTDLSLFETLEPSVFCDETEVARMDNGRYFTVDLKPGKHIFRSNDKQSGIELDAAPGVAYYLRVEIASGFMKGHGRLVLVQPGQGSVEIRKLQPLGANKVKDNSLVKAQG